MFLFYIICTIYIYTNHIIYIYNQQPRGEWWFITSEKRFMRTDIIRRTAEILCCKSRCRGKCKKEKKRKNQFPIMAIDIFTHCFHHPKYTRAHNGPESDVFVCMCVCVRVRVYTVKKRGSYNMALFSFFYFVTFLSVGCHPLRTGLAWDSKVRVGFCLLFYTYV